MMMLPFSCGGGCGCGGSQTISTVLRNDDEELFDESMKFNYPNRVDQFKSEAFGSLSPHSPPWTPSMSMFSSRSYPNQIFSKDIVDWTSSCFFADTTVEFNYPQYYQPISRDNPDVFEFLPLYHSYPLRESADGFVYRVKFKYTSKCYLLAPSLCDEFSFPQSLSSSQLIRNGDFVFVEADRGLDIGEVIAKFSLEGFKENRLAIGQSGSSLGNYKRVLRLASSEEVRYFLKKQLDEEKATEICQTKAFETGLQLTIVDSEFQFDRRKLTIYFEAHRFIDSPLCYNQDDSIVH